VRAGRRFDLDDRLIDFAVSACRIAEGLPRSPLGAYVAGQLIRCATSPASNHAEARGAESTRDFVHKMQICLKELRETGVWLRFIERMGLHRVTAVRAVAREADELVAVFVASIKTARRRL
jgi:four helix bundle protein